jgi:hypothetical protein
MPVARVASFNIADLPWPFEKPELQAIPNRVETIRSALDAYDYRLVQEDWFQRMTGLPCGHWYWFPSGLTLGTPVAHPPTSPACERHAHSGFASGDWLARKGWQRAVSQGVVFAHTHLDSGDADWAYRQEQALAVREALPTSGPLVLGGDFNTENQDERDWMDATFAAIGLAHASVATAKGKDHLYAREVVVSDAGEDADLSALSDHPAIWIEISWP